MPDLFSKLFSRLSRTAPSQELDMALVQFLAADTLENKRRLIASNPVLQHDTTLSRLISLAARTSSEEEASHVWQCACDLGREKYRMQKLPLSSERTWPALIRGYLVQHKPELLEQATQELGRLNLVSVTNFVRAYLARDRHQINRLSTEVEAQMWSHSQAEEALTVALTATHFWAMLAELAHNFPVDLQAQMLARGLQSCEEGIDLARLLPDEPCEAFFLSVKGSALFRANHVDAAEKVHLEVLAIRRRLAENDPKTYSAALANTLNSLANARRGLGRLWQAETAYQEAAQIRRRLWEQAPTARRAADLAMTLGNLSLLYSDLNRLDAAEKFALEAEALNRQLWLADADEYAPNLASALLKVGTIRRAQNRLAAARTAIEEAATLFRALWHEHPDHYAVDLADTLNDLGIVLLDSNEWDAAEAVQREAESIRRELWKIRPEVYAPALAKSLNNLGTIYESQNRLSEALAAYQQAVALYQDLWAQEPDQYAQDLARTLNNVGSIFQSHNLLDSAQAAYEQAQQLFSQLYEAQPEAYARGLADVFNNFGSLYTLQGRLPLAETAYRQAESLYRQAWQPQPSAFAPDLAMVSSNLGAILAHQHHWSEAKLEYRKAESIYRDLSVEQPSIYARESALIQGALANILFSQGEMQAAEEAHRKAVEQLRTLWVVEPDVYAVDFAMCLCNYGVLLNEKDAFFEAERVYREAETIVRRLWQEQREIYAPNLASTLTNLGNALRAQKRLAEAEDVFREAEAIRRRLWQEHPQVFASDLAETLNGLGLLLAAQNQYDKAEAAYQEAAYLDADNLSGARWQALANLGRLQQQQGNWDAGYVSLAQSLRDLEGLRSHLRTASDRRAFRSNYGDVYNAMIRNCLAQRRWSEAWYWVEHSKGRNLLDNLSGVPPRLDEPAPELSYQKWKQLDNQLRTLESQISELHGKARSLSDLARLEDLKQEHRQLRQEEAASRQQLAQSDDKRAAFVQVNILGPDELASRLHALTQEFQPVMAKRTLVVQYFQLDMDSYVVFLLPLWLLDDLESVDNLLRVREVNLPKDELLHTLHRFAHAVDSVDSGITEFAHLPEAIGRSCLWPWLDVLEELTPTELVLIAHATLHLLPLHAALLPDGTPLFESYPLAYLSSANSIRLLLERRQVHSKVTSRLVMGPPGSELPWASLEAQEVARLWRTEALGQPYQHEHMTLETLQENLKQRVKSLHLATHSALRSDIFERSCIFFHRDELTLFELISNERYDLHGCRLVYLNSCESGLSQVNAGDELQGLAWALMYAGASAVMATLWPVHDLAGYRMAMQFYYYLHNRGYSLMEAYTQALRTLHQQAEQIGLPDNPYYWAPFVLYGDGWLHDRLDGE